MFEVTMISRGGTDYSLCEDANLVMITAGNAVYCDELIVVRNWSI